MLPLALLTSVCEGKDASSGIFYQCVWGEGCLIWLFLAVCAGGRMLPLACIARVGEAENIKKNWLIIKISKYT